VLALVLAVSGGWPGPALAQKREARKQPLHIGMIDSLFRDMSEPQVQASMGPLRILVRLQTGLQAELIRSEDAFVLGEQLSSSKLQLGVFHGFELAWAQEKYPGLRPLLLAVNQKQLFHAHVLVSQKSKAQDLAGLEGKSLAMPLRSWEHCWLFLERSCRKKGKKVAEFFSTLTSPASMEDALDDVVDGAVEAAVVDSVSLDCYRRRKPGRYAKLKEILKSSVFPAAVVAYQAGAVDEATLRRFRLGMLNADKTAFGRQLLTLWRLTGFEEVPKDYEQRLKAVAEAYPPLEQSKSEKKAK
jgi:ABC-type phosphate/phosphonate transport system substrate-binding protein